MSDKIITKKLNDWSYPVLIASLLLLGLAFLSLFQGPIILAILIFILAAAVLTYGKQTLIDFKSKQVLQKYYTLGFVPLFSAGKYNFNEFEYVDIEYESEYSIAQLRTTMDLVKTREFHVVLGSRKNKDLLRVLTTSSFNLAEKLALELEQKSDWLLLKRN